jgi:pimeloyl-ACP methyl ester carboxylesterase
MLPIHLGADTRRLFGMFHARNPAMAARSAVLLCNPFGREAIQLHRLYRVLADRMSRVGCDVLRFDYYGTGESGGEDSDADLDLWAGDVLTAHAELLRRSGNHRVVWAGARLGATLAQRMAARAPLARLVLLDPIADGRDYLDGLREQHAENLIESERRQLPPLAATFRDDQTQFLDEASGFAVPRGFCDSLRAIRFAPDRVAADTVVICDSQTPNGRALAASVTRSPGVRLLNFSHGADWASSLVPPQVLNLLVTEAAGPQ